MEGRLRVKIDKRALAEQLAEALIAEAAEFDQANPGAGASDLLDGLLSNERGADPDFLGRNVDETEERLRALIAEQGAGDLPKLTRRAIAEQCVDFINAIKDSAHE
jgi:hypothetical protein